MVAVKITVHCDPKMVDRLYDIQLRNIEQKVYDELEDLLDDKDGHFWVEATY